MRELAVWNSSTLPISGIRKTEQKRNERLRGKALFRQQTIIRSRRSVHGKSMGLRACRCTEPILSPPATATPTAPTAAAASAAAPPPLAEPHAIHPPTALCGSRRGRRRADSESVHTDEYGCYQA